MPIYTYRCEQCGVQFERRQKFSDDPLKCCPECGHETLRKVYQPVGIVFKGSGFYSTDNRSPSGANRNQKKSDSAEGEGKSSSSEGSSSGEGSSSDDKISSDKKSSSSESRTGSNRSEK